MQNAKWKNGKWKMENETLKIENGKWKIETEKETSKH